MTNALDLLLGNEELLQKPSKEFIVRRLSRGEVEFKLTLEAVTMNQFKHIQQMCTDKRGTVDAIGVQVMLLTYGVREFNNKLTENKDKLQDTFSKLGVANSEGLVQKVLLPGEISTIASEITDLSGFGEDMVEEVKNF
ncbi:MAG: phage tail assembly chaperone [Clostridium sp.]